MTTLQDLQNHKDVQLKASVRYPDLMVAKYKKNVFFKGSFDQTLIEARGHVYHKDGTRVINSFTKVFNYGEKNELGQVTQFDRDALCTMIQKINGFLACATYVPQYDKVIISTTGSLDSGFVRYAEEMIPQSALDYIKNHGKYATFMFEIVHPDDPHIIEEKVGAYLLGHRTVKNDLPYTTSENKEFGMDYAAHQMRVMRPYWQSNVRFSDVVRRSKEVKHEGFMVYHGQQSLKLKSPYYLVSKMLARKADILSLDKSRIPEEYYDMVEHFKSMGESFNRLEEQERLVEMRNWIENQ